MKDLNIQHSVTSYECAADHLLKPASFMQYCQEAAETHASANNIGYEWSISNNLIWVEVQGDFEFVRRPEWKETINIRSNTGKASALQARRFVELSDKDGNVLARADLLWVLIDVNTRRPMPFKRINTHVNIPEECPALISTSLEIATEFTHTETTDFLAPRRDVDFNGHINNSAYLIWALDTLPAEHTPEGAPACFHLTFRKECMLGAEVEVQHYRSGSFTRHIINSAEGVRAEIEVQWS